MDGCRTCRICRIWRRVIGALAALVLASLPAAGAAELVLDDGQVLTGESLERKDDLYLLELESGSVLPIPIELVLEIRLTGDDDEQAERADVEPQERAELDDDAPASGIEPAEPRTLAGRPGGADLQDRPEQLAVLGPPARFARGVIDPVWRPRSDWGGRETDVTQFNPARWYRPPIDFRWRPTSNYTRATDVTNFDPADWYRPPIDSTWWPTDGFRRDDD